MSHTSSIAANKGRASYLGPRSIGHQDPGATSAYYLFETAEEVMANAEADTRDLHTAEHASAIEQSR
jgi:dihydroxyacetone kinase